MLQCSTMNRLLQPLIEDEELVDLAANSNKLPSLAAPGKRQLLNTPPEIGAPVCPLPVRCIVMPQPWNASFEASGPGPLLSAANLEEYAGRKSPQLEHPQLQALSERALRGTIGGRE